MCFADLRQSNRKTFWSVNIDHRPKMTQVCHVDNIFFAKMLAEFLRKVLSSGQITGSAPASWLHQDTTHLYPLVKFAPFWAHATRHHVGSISIMAKRCKEKATVPLGSSYSLAGRELALGWIGDNFMERTCDNNRMMGDRIKDLQFTIHLHSVWRFILKGEDFVQRRPCMCMACR